MIFITDKTGDLIIERLNKNGYKAYYVGGCVRNAVLQKQAYDYDICTSALPNTVCELFGDFSQYSVGKKHGTIALTKNGSVYEITTFRSESGYSDCRHPDAVVFGTDIHGDLSRRDFTCNAMAFNKNEGLIDDFNGYYDTENLILRAVGDPLKRFSEDALRVLRAIRFCSTDGFIAEEKTFSAAVLSAERLKQISVERIFTELKKIFEGKYVLRVLTEYEKVFRILFDLTQIPLQDYLKAANAAACGCEKFEIRFALFLYYATQKKVKKSCEIMQKFVKTSKTQKLIAFLTEHAEDSFCGDKIQAKVILSKVFAYKEEYIEFLKAAHIAKNGTCAQIEKLEDFFNVIIANGECYNLKTLAVNGSDLYAIGVKGKQTGELLEDILALVISEKLKNEKQQIIDYVNKNKRQGI